MILWFLVALLLAGQPETDPGRATQLFRQALDQDAELNLDSALVLLRAARDADLANLPIHLEYIARVTYWTPGGLPKLREEYANLPETPVTRCLRTYLEVTPELLHVLGPALLEMEEKGEGAGCPTVLLASVLSDMRPHHVWEPRRIEYFEKAISIAPETSGLWTQYSATLAGLGHYERAAEVLRDAVAVLSHPVQRVPLTMRRAGMIFLEGDTASAVELRKAVASAVSRDGRPGVRLQYLRERDAPLGIWESRTEGRPESNLLRLADFAQENGAWNDEWQARHSLGMRLSGWGEPLRAIAEFGRAIAIADSVGLPRLQAQSHYKRGRVLGDVNRRAEAEVDLKFAVAVAQASASAYYVAEAWHNLLQMYFDAGRLEDALYAAEKFLEAAEPLKHSPLRWAAHFMAGEVRWKLGWHAAANEAFETAVAVIDEHEENHNYAGEFFERQGDLARAREYFQRGVRAFGGGADYVRAENWAGLARVYLELGQLDSARVAAEAHDSEIRTERAVPLLPRVLAEQGQLEEAVELSSRWAERQLSAEVLGGAALAHLQWSELALRAGEAEAALAAALTADSLAKVMDMKDESIQAGRLRGLALAAQGDTAEALGILRDAIQRATSHGVSEPYRAAHLALADVLREGGHIDEALVAYEQAAEQVLETTAAFGMDFDRVRYRDRHLRPYDGGVLTLLRSRDRENRVPELVAWSQRRKGAAISMSLSNSLDGTEPAGTLPANEIQLRLGDTEAVVDFQVVDGNVSAMIVRNDSILLRDLPIDSDSLDAMVGALILPFSQVYGGRVDLARAHFDRALSMALYDSIWLPLTDALGGIHRVLLIPDGPLHRVPFAALVTGPGEEPNNRDGDGQPASQYLLDKYEIAYLPSLGFLRNRRDLDAIDPEFTRILGLEGMTPGAAEEMATIERVWAGGEVRVLSEAEASESMILSLGSEYDVLHFATHAISDDRDPLASHLKLVSDARSDGLLHPVEIGTIPGRHRLVILSACETQSGRSFQGEGLMGLSRAFLANGAEAVVGTQWLLGGQAAELMGVFYSALSSGATPSAALRSAQLATRNQPETSHPFFWAGLVLHMGGQ